MNAKILVMAPMLLLSAAVVGPTLALALDKPGTVVDPADFVRDTLIIR